MSGCQFVLARDYDRVVGFRRSGRVGPSFTVYIARVTAEGVRWLLPDAGELFTWDQEG